MQSLPEVSAGEGLERMKAGGVVLLDVREQDEWDRGHSPLATLVPMSEFGARIDDVPDDVPLLVVCHSGVRSARVTAALIDAGYDATSVAGGMIAWRSAGGEVVADDGRIPSVE